MASVFLSRILLTKPAPRESEGVVSDAIVRLVEKRAAVIDDDVARLRFVRKSIAAVQHRATVRQRERQASRHRLYLSFRTFFTALLSAAVLVPQAPHRLTSRPLPLVVPRQIEPEVGSPKVWLVERQGTVPRRRLPQTVKTRPGLPTLSR